MSETIFRSNYRQYLFNWLVSANVDFCTTNKGTLSVMQSTSKWDPLFLVKSDTLMTNIIITFAHGAICLFMQGFEVTVELHTIDMHTPLYRLNDLHLHAR